MRLKHLVVIATFVAVSIGRGTAISCGEPPAPQPHQPSPPVPTCLAGKFVNIEPGQFPLTEVAANIHQQTGIPVSAKGSAAQRTVTLEGPTPGAYRMQINIMLHYLLRANAGLAIVRHSEGMEFWDEAERKEFLQKQAAGNSAVEISRP